MVDSQSVKDRLVLYIKYLGIGQRKFEMKCGLSNGYVNNIRKSITPEKLQQIALCCDDLNTGWLMTGEGDMLKTSISQEVTGDNNTAVAGNGNHVNASSLIEELTAQRKLTEKAQEQVSKAQEQIDKLLSIIERMTVTS